MKFEEGLVSVELSISSVTSVSLQFSAERLDGDLPCHLAKEAVSLRSDPIAVSITIPTTAEASYTVCRMTGMPYSGATERM